MTEHDEPAPPVSASPAPPHPSGPVPTSRGARWRPGIVAATVLVVLAGAAAWWTLGRSDGRAYESNGLTFHYPNGWLLEDTPSDQALEGTIASVGVFPEGGGGEVTIIASRADPLSPADTPEVLTTRMSDLLRLLNGDRFAGVIVEPSREDLNGYQAYRAVVDVRFGRQATTQRVVQVYERDMQAMITCEYDGDHESVVSDGCHQILDSFRLP
jgi:hypothetical protein